MLKKKTEKPKKKKEWKGMKRMEKRNEGKLTCKEYKTKYKNKKKEEFRSI